MAFKQFWKHCWKCSSCSQGATAAYFTLVFKYHNVISQMHKKSFSFRYICRSNGFRMYICISTLFAVYIFLMKLSCSNFKVQNLDFTLKYLLEVIESKNKSSFDFSYEYVFLKEDQITFYSWIVLTANILLHLERESYHSGASGPRFSHFSGRIYD